MKLGLNKISTQSSDKNHDKSTTFLRIENKVEKFK